MIIVFYPKYFNVNFVHLLYPPLNSIFNKFIIDQLTQKAIKITKIVLQQCMAA